jgi:hypothetical protein
MDTPSGLHRSRLSARPLFNLDAENLPADTLGFADILTGFVNGDAVGGGRRWRQTTSGQEQEHAPQPSAHALNFTNPTRASSVMECRNLSKQSQFETSRKDNPSPQGQAYAIEAVTSFLVDPLQGPLDLMEPER